jgi:hypothetical protein
MDSEEATPRVTHTRKTFDISDHNGYHKSLSTNHHQMTGISSAAEPTTTMGHQKGGESSSGQPPAASANESSSSNNTKKQPGHIIAGNKDSAPFEPSVEDQVAVGTDQILQSPHVSEGPGRVANAPVPSVFVSSRLTDVCVFGFILQMCCPFGWCCRVGLAGCARHFLYFVCRVERHVNFRVGWLLCFDFLFILALILTRLPFWTNW